MRDYAPAPPDLLPPAPRTQRWVRDPSERQLAGVAAMVASALGVSPTLVRLAFLLSLVAGAAGFWIYVLLWSCTPFGERPAPIVRLRDQLRGATSGFGRDGGVHRG